MPSLSAVSLFASNPGHLQAFWAILSMATKRRHCLPGAQGDAPGKVAAGRRCCVLAVAVGPVLSAQHLFSPPTNPAQWV